MWSWDAPRIIAVEAGAKPYPQHQPVITSRWPTQTGSWPGKWGKSFNPEVRVWSVHTGSWTAMVLQVWFLSQLHPTAPRNLLEMQSWGPPLRMTDGETWPSASPGPQRWCGCMLWSLRSTGPYKVGWQGTFYVILHCCFVVKLFILLKSNSFLKQLHLFCLFVLNWGQKLVWQVVYHLSQTHGHFLKSALRG